MKRYSPQDILDAREERVEIQERALKEFKCPLLVIRVNFPGTDKNNRITNEIIKIMEQCVFSVLSTRVKNRIFISDAEGPVLILSVEGKDIELKKKAIEFEEMHPLGRLADIDVYDFMGKALSRTDLGFDNRKCYICGGYAHECVRTRRHNEKAIIKYIEDKYLEYICF